MPIEKLVHQYFIHHQLTLSVAESCTGGALSARITRQPGCSAYYLGGVVSYSNQLKINLLGVQQETLSLYGAVSREVVTEMIEGILRITGSDYGIAISGIAGPEGGSLEQPVGSMWGAIGRRGQQAHAWRFHVEGERQTAIQAAIDVLLNKLIKYF